MENNKRNRWLHLRLTQSEYDQIKGQFDKTTSRKLSDFARKKLLDKPLIGTYRDASMDGFMEQLAGLKNGVSATGNIFSQAVKKLHTLDQIKGFEHWLISYELDKRKLLNQIEEVSVFIRKIADKWLR